MPSKKTTLAKLIDSGWDIKFTNDIRHFDEDRKGRDFYCRVTWKARREKQNSYGDEWIIRESRWQGFKTAKEALNDLLSKVKPLKFK